MLLKPVVLPKSALAPMAVFALPVVLFRSTLSPRDVLSLLRLQPSWQTARASGESPNQASMNGMRRNARKGERFIKFLNGRVVVFIY
ncbi:MAG: hypothetical protein DME34_10975, partial [Verrucomicrobia bacterium]